MKVYIIVDGYESFVIAAYDNKEAAEKHLRDINKEYISKGWRCPYYMNEETVKSEY